MNYAKEQEFSDASDVFEDSDDSAPKTTKKRGRPRKSDGNELASAQEDETFKKAEPIYTERGYDPSLPPIRERFPFLPEFEPDGSPRIDLIVGRRAIDEKEDSKENEGEGNEDEKKDEGELSDDDEGGGGQRRKKGRRNSNATKGKQKKASPKKGDTSGSGPVEYEYLIKYKGRSYLHLEWKSGADLESMNKSAKGIYRRYLKKIGSGDEELEDPNFDPSYAIPQRICDEAQQEITVDLSDKELLKWEKERAKELAAEDDSDDSEDDKAKKQQTKKDDPTTKNNEKEEAEAEESKGTFTSANIRRCPRRWTLRPPIFARNREFNGLGR